MNMSRCAGCNIRKIYEENPDNRNYGVGRILLALEQRGVKTSLTVIFTASTAYSGLPFLQMMLYLFVPFNVTCCGCLTVLDHVKSRQAEYFCAAVCIFCIAAFSRLSLIKKYYEAAATEIWAVLFFCSLAYFILELAHTFRSPVHKVWVGKTCNDQVTICYNYHVWNVCRLHTDIRTDRQYSLWLGKPADLSTSLECRF